MMHFHSPPKPPSRLSAQLAAGAISPIGAVVLAYVIYICSAAMPPDYYTSIVHEQDFMYGSLPLFGFYTLSCGAFLAGFLILNLGLNRYLQPVPADRPVLEKPGSYYLYLLLAGVALNLYSLYVLMRNTPGAIDMIFSARAETLKASIDTSGGFTQAQPLLIGLIWLAIGKHMARFADLRSKKAWISLGLITVSVLLSVTLSLVKVARYEIMPLIFGMAIVGAISLHRTERLRFWSLLIKSVGFAVVIGLIFVGFTLLRGARNDDQLASGVVGYGPAAFNHLAAMLEGRFQFPYKGSGAYVLAFLSFIPFLHSLIDVQSLLHLPDLSLLINSEFAATRDSGLNGDYIWITAPGYYYSDLGEGVYLLLFAMGAWSALLWRQVRQGNAFAMVLYPFLLASVMMWFSFSMFTRPQLVTFLAVGAIAYVFDLFRPRQPVNTPLPNLPEPSAPPLIEEPKPRVRRSSGTILVAQPYYYQYQAPEAQSKSLLQKLFGWLWGLLLRLVGWST